MAIRSPKIKIIIHDICAIGLAWIFAFLSRFNFTVPPEPYLESNLHFLPTIVILQSLVLWRYRLYRGLWRFASVPDLWNIIRASIIGTIVISVSLFAFNRLETVPRSILVLYPIFLVFFLGGPRLAYRLWKDKSFRETYAPEGAQRVIVIGAGDAGEAIVRDMIRSSSYFVVGIVDDAPELQKGRIHGVTVLGAIADLESIVSKTLPDLLVIAIPSATGEQMREIVQSCEKTRIPFRTLPKLEEYVGGETGIHEVRNVKIDDLLARDKVQLERSAIRESLQGEVVLITGGGGSIGAELCRQVCGLEPAELLVLEKSEFNIYNLELELKTGFPNTKSTFILGDVCNEATVQKIFQQHAPSCVFHAAAYKHVPILEQNIIEAARNNVLGSEIVARNSAEFGADKFVLISTDKAVRPSSVMGSSKRLAEMLCQYWSKSVDTRFITVRFGNVLDSTGSVVPLFRRQIEAGGPVTVTHPDAERYFMTIPEACELILQASAVGKGGEIFTLDMGKPISIKSLAEQMIRLSGKIPNKDIFITYTGLRPGEKMREELFHENENVSKTQYEKLFLASSMEMGQDVVERLLSQLRLAVSEGNDTRLGELFKAKEIF